ncbi:MAG: hypothetical protein DI609_00410 [Corynebacterium urealyticum]|uniref:Uncharacterized protein n=1 Tax=Corynebacterium urealyticum TaxID=43771 RepID=A0A2W5BEY0_9CORY|nr:MAG: hypothetical protein DI609_00410 [Corynebacterium urealyticum]
MYTDTDDSDYADHTAAYNAAVTKALNAAVEAAEARAAYVGSGHDESYAAHADVTQAIFEDLRENALKLRNSLYESRIFGTLDAAIENGQVEMVARVRDRWVGQTQPWVVKTYELTQEIEDTRNRLASLRIRRREAVSIALSHGSTVYQIAAVTGCEVDEVQDWGR